MIFLSRTHVNSLVSGIFHSMKDSAYFLYTLGLVSKIKLIFVNVTTVQTNWELKFIIN